MARDTETDRALIRLANLHKDNPRDPEKIAAARADLSAAKIRAFIERELTQAPPISAVQRARLARLLIVDGGNQ